MSDDAAFTTVFAVIEPDNGTTVALYDARELAEEHLRLVLARSQTHIPGWARKLGIEEMPLFDAIPADWPERS